MLTQTEVKTMGISNHDDYTLYISCSGFSLSIFMPEKTEVFCRILVGDTLFNIMVRYSLDCLMVLVCVYLLSTLVNVYWDFGLTNNLYLVPIFIVYILISAKQVRKYENIFKEGNFIANRFSVALLLH